MSLDEDKPAADAALARIIAAEIRPVLAGQSVWIHGAVLASLVGNFLAENVVEHDYAATELKRVAIMHALLDAAFELVTAHDKDGVAGHA